MEIKLIDTHAHIYDKKFKADVVDVIQRAQEAGVTKIYLPNIDHTTIDAMLELEQRFPELCVPMMGLHPSHVKADFEKELYVVEDWLNKRPFIAVGECGLDFYWDLTHKEQQLEALKIQLAWAGKYEIPIILHTREANRESIDLIAAYKNEGQKGIFHCFSGTVEEGQEMAALGFKIGLGGVLTFKNSGLREVVKELPADALVLETDSPYLAPTPYRGKRNEPAYTRLVAETLAQTLEKPLEEIAQLTTENAEFVFVKK